MADFQIEPWQFGTPRTLRLRVNVSQTSTGKYSWDCTAEMEGGTRAEVLAESDALVAELKARYPAPEAK